MTPPSSTLAGSHFQSNRRSFLPSVSGHEMLDDSSYHNDGGDLRLLPSQQPREPRQSAGGGGLRIANASPPSSSAGETSDGKEEWPQEAIMHMNLASTSLSPSRDGAGSSGSRPTSKKDSRGAKLGMHVYGQATAPGPPLPSAAQGKKKDGGEEAEGWAPEGYGNGPGYYGHAM